MITDILVCTLMLCSCDKVDRSGWVIPGKEDPSGPDTGLVVPDGLTDFAAGKFYLFDTDAVSGYSDVEPLSPWTSGTRLTDDAVGTGYGSRTSVGWMGDKVEIVVDLGSVRNVENIFVHSFNDAAASVLFPGKIEVQYAEDKESAWDQAEGAIAFDGSKSAAWGELVLPKVDCRYVKLVLTSADAAKVMMVDEVKVFGKFEPDLKYVPESGCYHGAFNNGTSFADNTDPDIVINNKSCPIDTYESLVGKQLSMMLWYQSFTNASGQLRYFDEMQQARARHSGFAYDGRYRFFLYGWLPDDYTAAQLAGGRLDGYLDRYFREISESSEVADMGPVWFRPANEMNSNWLTYTGDPVNYVKFWRRMYNIAEQYGLTGYNVFVWSPNDVTFNATNHVMPDAVMSDFYPGDIYVDWVGVSCYPTSRAGYLWPKDLLKEVSTLAKEHGKPLMISEGGYGQQIPDAYNPELVTDFFDEIKKLGIKAFIWENHKTDGNGDRRIHIFPDALDAYREAVKDSYFLDMIPDYVYREIETRKNTLTHE